jgi:hypothetical protein
MVMWKIWKSFIDLEEQKISAKQEQCSISFGDASFSGI